MAEQPTRQGRMMLSGWDRGTPDVAHLERIETLVRDRFDLSCDRIVMVSDDRAQSSGATAESTTILFWTGTGERHRIRLFKPPTEVIAEDLPPSWLRATLRDDGDIDCC